jgi:DNA-binding MarR family transcriptional regulator
LSTLTDNRLIGELLRNPNAARVRFVEQGFAAAGHPAIRPPHFPILEYIDRERGSRVSYLAQHANVTAQAMGELVDHLAAHGYVERTPDPTDGRARLVRLTPRGQEAYRLAGNIVSELERHWSEAMGEHEFRRLKELLARLWDAIEPERTGA